MNKMRKEAMNRVKGKIGLKANCILETDDERQIVWDAINALEKADLYRWHDLRKNPDDCPDDYSYLREQVLFAWHGSDGTTWYECGWFYHGIGSKDVTPYFSVNDCKFMIGDEYRDVFAWRYIEPFEEDEK